jgi:hypothetical protein
MNWIGMIYVRPERHSTILSSGAAGAYTNVVAVANTERQYREMVLQRLSIEGLVVIEFFRCRSRENLSRKR